MESHLASSLQQYFKDRMVVHWPLPLSAQPRTGGPILYAKHCTADLTYLVLFIQELRAEPERRLGARIAVQTIGTVVTSSRACQISCYLAMASVS